MNRAAPYHSACKTTPHHTDIEQELMKIYVWVEVQVQGGSSKHKVYDRVWIIGLLQVILGFEWQGESIGGAITEAASCWLLNVH
jgi:hypothetical protein